MREFNLTIENSGYPRALVLEIYDDRAAMIQAVRAAHKAEDMDMGEKWYGETVATTTGQWLEDDDGRVVDKRLIVRLSKGSIKHSTIAHEAAHGAVFLYQNDIQKTIPDMDREEQFCYIVGEITEKITDTLRANKIPILR